MKQGRREKEMPDVGGCFVGVVFVFY